MKPANRLFQLFINARLATLLCCSLLVSCGGSGSVTTAGIGGTGISYGAVSGFGSIILNGSHLDDDTAVVTLDGVPGDDLLPHRGLKQGMVVKVSGTFSGNTGTAESIEYRDSLEGPVCALAASIVPPIVGIITLRVLGQTVILDATTIVDNNDQINFNDIIEVSGLPNEFEQIQASFVEVKNSATLIEVKGFVDDVDINAEVLTINALDVDYSGSGVIDTSIPGGVPTVGQFVEVKGLAADFTCGSGVNDTLTATKVELEPEGAGAIPDGVNAEIEGLVTNIDLLPDSFMIGNRLIDITSSPRYLPQDFGVGNIELGTKVEAEGTSANGVLTATKISFRENVKLESDVATIISGSLPTFSFKLVGLPNITITTNSLTTGNAAPTNTGVAPTGHIRVRGIEGPNKTVLATRIQNQSGSSVILQGAVDNSLGPLDTEITILGTPVDTILIPDISSNFQDVDHMSISRATFLNLVQPGVLVKFKGALTVSPPPTITWDEAELEDD